MKFTFYFKYKKLVFNILILALIFFLLLNSRILILSISKSIDIFIYKLIPALFPYLLITELLMHSNKIYDLSYGISFTLAKLFKIPIHTTSVVIIGFLLGYPNAAKCILKMYNDKKVDQKLATKLISFTSNANPSYILATVGIGIFNSIEIGIILTICHFVSALVMGMFLTPSYNNYIIQQKNVNSNSFDKIYSPFELLSTSILGCLKTLSYIFAYTVIFSLIPAVIFSNLNISNLIKSIAVGIFEITNGINNVSLLNITLNNKIILTSFILSFSSIMILIQIFTYASKAKILFKDLLKYKLLQGCIAAFVTHIVLRYIYTPTVSVFNNIDNFSTISYIAPFYTHIILLITVLLLLVIYGKKRQAKPVA